MTQRIEVPGMGIVEFPDSMNDDQIASAIKQNMAPQTAAQKEKEPIFSATGLPAKAMGAFETGLATVTGSIAPVLAVPAGIYGTLASGKYGTQEGIREGERVAKQVMEKLTYQPTTEKGQEYVENVGRAFEASKLPPVMAGPTGMIGLNGMGPKGAFRQGAGFAGEMAQTKVVDPTIAGVKAVPDVYRGAVGRATGNIAKPGEHPEVWQQRSARQPVNETYIPPEQMADWQQGKISTAEATAASQPWTPEQVSALRRTQGNVPFKGQVGQAVGEQLIEPYTNWKGYIPDIALGVGGTMLGVGPYVGPALNLLRKGIKTVRGINQVGAMNQLGDVGLTPLYKEELQALKTGAPHPSAIGPAAGPIPSQAQPTPAAQAAMATTQAKANQSGVYDIRFGRNAPEPTAATAPMPEPQIQPQVQPQAQTAGPVKPSVEQAFNTARGIVGDDPTLLKNAAINAHADALFKHYGGVINKQTAKTKAKMDIEAYNTAQEQAALAAKQAADAERQAAEKAAFDATPLGQQGLELEKQLAENPDLLPQVKRDSIRPENIERLKRRVDTHENTEPIKQALEQKIKDNPDLAGFDQPYVIPKTIAKPINKFLNGETRYLIAEGPRGTGKSSLALEWERRTPEGRIHEFASDMTREELQKAIDASFMDPALFLFDEADQFTKLQQDMISEAQNKASSQSKFLYTTNHPEKLPEVVKAHPTVKLDIKLTPEEKSAFALNVAKKYNVNKTPAEIEAIAQRPDLNNFRSLEKEISSGYTIKEPLTGMFGVKSPAEKMPQLPKEVNQILDDLQNNNLSRNAIIFDADAFKAEPNLETYLRNWAGLPNDITESTPVADIRAIAKTIKAGDPHFGNPMLFIVDSTNAKKIDTLKNALELGNRKPSPKNVIFLDKQNLLSDPMVDRAHVIGGDSFAGHTPDTNASLFSAPLNGPKSANPSDMKAYIDSVNKELGIDKKPKKGKGK